MILSHCHAGPPGYFRSLEAERTADEGTLEHLARYLGELGYARGAVFAPFKCWFPGDPNVWLLEAVRGDARFVPWVTVNETGAAAATALQAAIRLGARGVKFHPPVVKIAVNDPSLGEFYALAEDHRLPVLYHTGPHGWHLSRYNPLLVDDVAQRHPKLPLIVEHLGGAAFVHETYAVMQNNRNVYGGLATCLPDDASWHVPAERIAALIKEFGADRFVFGADFPYNSVETNRRALEVLKGMGLPHADVSLIASGNLDRVLEAYR